MDEPLSNEELIELTKADEAPLTKNQLFDTSGNKHWVAVGGGTTSAGNDILGYNETYYKLFHLNISLDHNANGGYDSPTSTASAMSSTVPFRATRSKLSMNSTIL